MNIAEDPVRTSVYSPRMRGDIFSRNASPILPSPIGATDDTRMTSSLPDMGGYMRVPKSSANNQGFVHASMDSFDLTNTEILDNSNNAHNFRTNIATQHFTNFERLVFAISDDDVQTFDRLGIPIEEVANFEFDGGQNVLNFAIE